MIKNLLLWFFILLSLTMSVFYIRLRNNFNRVFWSVDGWATIAGVCQAEIDYINGTIKKEHYEKIAKDNLEHVGDVDKLDTVSWITFSGSYNHKLEELESKKSADEKKINQEETVLNKPVE